MPVERSNARRQITIVVGEQLRAPASLDSGLVVPHAGSPVLTCPLIVLATALHFDDFPIWVGGGDNLFEPRRDATGKDCVGHPAHVADVLADPRYAITQDRL